MNEEIPMTKRTRIVLMIRDLGHAGAQRQLVALACGMNRTRLDVTVVSFYGGPLLKELEDRGIRVLCIGKKHRWDMLGFLWRTIRTLRALRPEVLYTFLNESNLLGALFKPWLHGTRLVWGLRDSQTDAALYGLLGRLVFHLTTKLSAVPDLHIANSHSGAAYYTALGYPAPKMRVVPNGIDVTRFQRDDAAGRAVRTALGIPEGTKLLGLVGRLSPMKDHLTALQALALTPAHVHLLIVGRGDDGYSALVREEVSKLKLTARVHWSPAREDMPAVFSAVDALVSSSAYGEGFSNVIGEAMACGVPCAATHVGDSALLVGENRFMAPPRDPEALAKAIENVLDSSPVSSVRQRIEHEFSVSRMVDATTHLLTAPVPRAIAIITTGLGTGGAEMMLTQLCATLDRSSFAPEVVSLTAGGKHVSELQALGIPVHTLGMKAGRPGMGALIRLCRTVRRMKPVLLVGWMYHGNLAATLASWFARRVPVIWNVRQSLYDLTKEKRGSAMVIKLLARLSRSPARIIYNSRISAQQHEALGYCHERTLITANGFNTEAFRPDATARRSVLEELGLDEDSILVGRFGRNSAMKDFPSFLEAARLVHAELPKVHFLIAGTGTETLSQGANVHLLGERHDLPRLTAALDVACSSSAFGEGFPNVVAEAMSCAVPVVATDVGDTAWLLSGLARTVPASDPSALATALLEVIRFSPGERLSMGLALRQRIQDHFTLQAVVRDFEALLLDTLEPSASSTSSQRPCVA